MKRLLYIIAIVLFTGTSCADFLDTVPHDALSPSTTWKTELDAEKFLIGCYDGWTVTSPHYMDAASDFGFNFHVHEGYHNIGNGRMTANNEVANFYGFRMIRRTNDFLTNIENVEFADEAKKNNMIGQVKTIRAFQYFERSWYLGGIPIIDSYDTAEEAQVARNTEEEVKKFIFDEIDEAIELLYDEPAAKGHIAKGTALAIKMRSALYYGEYQRAKDAARAIMDLGLYELHDDYADLFSLNGQNSKEIIISVQRLENLYSSSLGALYNNGDGGWSSAVPTMNLVELYEMSNGLTKEEAGSGYDAKSPFANRDPRMELTVLFPGMDWNGRVLNTLDKEIDGKANPDFPITANNSSKTGLTWGKYLLNMSQYTNIWNTSYQTIVFRYAEVLLSYVEAENELNGPSAEIYSMLDDIRVRAGMPVVDRAKYGTKETLRELIRRERSVELAGEGFRRSDIMRWKDASGKMLAETLMSGELLRYTGTVNYTETDQYKRGVITGTEKVEDRIFQSHHRYFPISQSAIDKNPKLVQNPGY